MANDPHARRLLWFVFAGSRGGPSRLGIVRALMERPSNINQLAGALGLDYKAVQHHVRVLEKNSLVVREGERYAVTYFASPLLEANIESFEEIARKLEKSK